MESELTKQECQKVNLRYFVLLVCLYDPHLQSLTGSPDEIQRPENLPFSKQFLNLTRLCNNGKLQGPEFDNLDSVRRDKDNSALG
jgi:hypothetical protein